MARNVSKIKNSLRKEAHKADGVRLKGLRQGEQFGEANGHALNRHVRRRPVGPVLAVGRVSDAGEEGPDDERLDVPAGRPAQVDGHRVPRVACW